MPYAVGDRARLSKKVRCPGGLKVEPGHEGEIKRVLANGDYEFDIDTDPECNPITVIKCVVNEDELTDPQCP